MALALHVRRAHRNRANEVRGRLRGGYVLSIRVRREIAGRPILVLGYC